MTISSMTGFGRADGEHEADHWAWEIRSVNGRNLDTRCRLPAGCEGLEQEVRKRLSARFKRGSIQINLHLKRHNGKTEIAINEEALAQVLSAMKDLSAKIDAQKPSLDGIMALKGIVETREPEESDEQRDVRERALFASFGDAIQSLAESRGKEGQSLEQILVSQIDQISNLADQAFQIASEQPDKLRQRLKTQVTELLQTKTGISEERLAQELAVLATKSDVREEVDRLRSHCDAARALLNQAGPVGRKLDFLTQEFNREANTLCSKSVDVSLTQIGLDLKTVIDQMREQVQNIE